MPCFNSVKNKVNCMLNSSGNGLPMIRRRMGVTSSGTVVLNDIFGEPINISSTGVIDIYNDMSFYAILKKAKQPNNEESKSGGSNAIGTKKALDILASNDLDILKNDLIEYPIASNEWYRVYEIDPIAGFLNNIIATPEVRHTK